MMESFLLLGGDQGCSATPNIWIIFPSGLSAILAGAFSMAGGEYVLFHTKDTEEAAGNREQAFVDRDPKLARGRISLPRLSSKWRMRNFRKDFDRTGISGNIPPKPWLKRNMVSNTRSLPILCMLLPLASLLFCWFPSSNALISFSFQLTIAFR